MCNCIRPEHAKYEARYRAVYDAGVPFSRIELRAEDYRRFLKQQSKHGRLIDFGCGEGFPAVIAAEMGYEVLAIDAAPSAIAKAEQTHRHPKLKFMLGDVCDLADVPSACFDIAVDLGCLHMLVSDDDARRYLAHAFRVLRPYGVAYYQNLVPAEDAQAWFPRERELVEWWRERISQRETPDFFTETYEVNGRTIEVKRPRTPAAFRDVQTQVSLLCEAGFQVQEARVVMRGVNSPFEVILIAVKPGGSPRVPVTSP